jgi:hypothetical protein
MSIILNGSTGVTMPDGGTVLETPTSATTGHVLTATSATAVAFQALPTSAGLGANTFTGAQVYSDQNHSRAMLIDCGNVVVAKGNINNATVTFDYTGGSVQSFTATGSTVTWAFSNWPPTGNLGELLVIATNAGAFTQAISGVTWIKPDGTTTTSVATYLAANTGRVAFQTSGVDQILFWSSDAGTTIYGKLI